MPNLYHIMVRHYSNMMIYTYWSLNPNSCRIYRIAPWNSHLEVRSFFQKVGQSHIEIKIIFLK
jgi:hypothetical protein